MLHTPIPNFNEDQTEPIDANQKWLSIKRNSLDIKQKDINKFLKAISIRHYNEKQLNDIEKAFGKFSKDTKWYTYEEYSMIKELNQKLEDHIKKQESFNFVTPNKNKHNQSKPSGDHPKTKQKQTSFKKGKGSTQQKQTSSTEKMQKTHTSHQPTSQHDSDEASSKKKQVQIITQSSDVFHLDHQKSATASLLLSPER